MTRLPLDYSIARPTAPLLDGTDPWQMAFGERAVIAGLLSDIEPAIAIEIGTAEGGSLRRIARHSKQVHAFDLLAPDAHIRSLPNVQLHTGDSHKLLPELLARLTSEGKNVDFALVDGDHSADGVAQDMIDLLESPAVGRTVIVMHDSMNEEVRRGLESVDYEHWPKVSHVDLDCLAGFLFRAPLDRELWGGLALVVVDADNPRPQGMPAYQQRYHPHHPIMVAGRDRMLLTPEDSLQGQLDEARQALSAERRELQRHREGLAVIRQSVSWRATAPLRALAKFGRQHRSPR